jgi:hypothetical protein
VQAARTLEIYRQRSGISAIARLELGKRGTGANIWALGRRPLAFRWARQGRR